MYMYEAAKVRVTLPDGKLKQYKDSGKHLANEGDAAS